MHTTSSRIDSFSLCPMDRSGIPTCKLLLDVLSIAIQLMWSLFSRQSLTFVVRCIRYMDMLSFLQQLRWMVRVPASKPFGIICISDDMVALWYSTLDRIERKQDTPTHKRMPSA